MPRPTINLDPYKDEIIALLNEGKSARDLMIMLKERHDVTIGVSTIKKRLQKWEIVCSRKTDTVQNRVAQLLPRLNTKEILDVLQKEGMPSSARTLQRIRRRLGIRLCIDEPEERAERDREIEAVLKQEQSIGKIDGLGRRLLYSHMRG
ncbi:hypothetical protein N7520_006259 [Penicillium odoratum]|uniref:uncharacterized protein n=1 Tax=Penicillium odoratum TaxID=1167516 RepID=UPI002549AFDB|nr:uncharacterized protein N7520_006259 [Penicillium odoratum]KAJ5759103.1 hypothetical protein N7520_006259 [Penicillium odoratum]